MKSRYASHVYRGRDNTWGPSDDQNIGRFYLQHPISKQTFCVIASNGMGWEHVSFSLPHRTPTWEEACWIKDLFWEPDECVVQFHPPRSEYINNHPHCLHLWKPLEAKMPRPLPEMVGTVLKGF